MCTVLNVKESQADLWRYVQYESIFTSVSESHCPNTAHKAHVDYLQFATNKSAHGSY